MGYNRTVTLRCLKNLKLFAVRVKELLEPIVLWTKADGFLLFLKAFSWETDLWVTLGDFMVKNAKLARGICILLKIDYIETCVTYVQKDFQIWTLIKPLLTKYQIFMKLPQISHIHENHNF